MTSPPARRSAPTGSASHGAGRQASSAPQTTRRWTDVAPNEPPEDHHDDGWWASLVDEVESGLIVEVDR